MRRESGENGFNEQQVTERERGTGNERKTEKVYNRDNKKWWVRKKKKKKKRNNGRREGEERRNSSEDI